MKNKLIILTGLTLGFAPLLAFAQDTSKCSSLPSNPKFQDLVCYVVNSLLSAVVPLIFALAIAVFVWGIVRYVINADNDTEREKGKQLMIWGIVGLAVMISVWGLVRILTNTFNINFGIPQVHE